MPSRRKGSYKPNTRRDRDTLAAIDAGVMAAAERYRDAVMEYWESLGVEGELGLGYLHGDYAEGEAEKVYISPVRTSRGRRVADVYSAAERNGHPYPVYWEIGHHNRFTGNWEQVPIFSPALFLYHSQIMGAMARIIADRFYMGNRSGLLRRMVRARSGMIQVGEE